MTTVKFSIFSASIISLVLAGFCCGQVDQTIDSLNNRKVDILVQDAMKDKHIPGLALVVLKNGKALKEQAYGLANVESRLPTTTKTVFRIGSVSKTFVATAIMMLVEEGILDLDQPVRRYLTETPEKWEGIYIRHLLTHTSGIPDFLNEDVGINPYAETTDIEVFKAIADRDLRFAPGDGWGYSNGNYHVLALIINRISGEFYGEFLRKRIFEPLGMSQTTISPSTGTVMGLAAGYAWENDSLRPGDMLANSIKATGPGGILSTVVDMAKWDEALYTESLLKQSTLRRMWTPVQLNNGDTPSYGFGWIIGDPKGRRSVWHNGGISGFSSAMYRLPDDGIAVIILANLMDFGADALAQEIAGIYLPL